KSPTPPRRNVVCRPSGPSPQAQVKPRRGETCTSLGIRSVRTPNRESTARLYSGAPLNRAASSRAPYVSRKPPPRPPRQVSPAYTALFHALPGWTCGRTVRANTPGLSAGQPESCRRLPALARHIAAELVDEVAAEERGQRGHDAAAARRARAPGRGQGEAADARRLLGLPVAVEPEGEGVDVARLPIEPQQA